MCGEVFLSPSGVIIAIESKRELLEPLNHGFNILSSFLLGDNILHDSETVLEKIISPIAIGNLNIRNNCVWHIEDQSKTQIGVI